MDLIDEILTRAVEPGEVSTTPDLVRGHGEAYFRVVELRSPQCVVRSYRPSDAADIARYGTNRKVWQNLRDRFPHPFREVDGAEYIERVLKSPHQTSFAIDVGGTAIGGISLHIGTDIERIGAELGYWIGEDYWGRGIATAAIQLVTPYAFDELGLVRVFAVPFCENIASCRALEKAVRARGNASAKRDQGWANSRSVPVRLGTLVGGERDCATPLTRCSCLQLVSLSGKSFRGS